MTWKKLLAGVTGSALLVGWAVSLTDCTVCSGPQCFNTDGSVTDTGTSETSTGDGGGDSGSMGCSAIKPQGKLFWDNMQGTGPCDKCMTNNCCSVSQACLADKGAGDGSMDTCGDYVSCIDACGGDMTCEGACGQTDPSGKMKYEQEVLLGCMYVKCGVSCMVSDAGM